MKINSSLDDHIKKQFSNYEPEVPSHIWENIVASGNKKRPLAFWLNLFKKYGAIILVIILAGAGFILYNTPAGQPNKIAVAQPAVERIEKSKLTSVGTENNKQNLTSNLIINENSDELKATTNDVDQKMITVNDATKTSTGGSTTTNSIGLTSTGKVSVAGVAGVDKTTTGFVSKQRQHRNEKGNTSATITAPPIESQQTDIDDVVSNAPVVTSEDLLLKRSEFNAALLRVQNNNALTITKVNVPVLDIPCPKAERNASGNKRYIEVYGGPDYAFRSIKDTGNSSYMKKREESSKFTSAFSVGMRYTNVFNNGMSFRTGINYSQINEKFKYEQGNIIQVVYITNSNGDTTGSFTTSGTRYKTTFNRFKTIDVPVVVGYEMGNSRLHININAGAVVNVYSWQKGDVLDTAYKPIEITTGKGSSPYQFKTNAGLGFIGGISLYYKISERLHFLAEPYFRYNFSPASKSDLTLKQKYNTAGLRLGLRFDL